ncbi:MAG: ThuA domain-containing protein [Bryobacterales bacterium]|nr:ThuA domain-containing protein [Bryobacterales bacterium]
MRSIRILLATLLAAGIAFAQNPEAPKRKKILAIGQTKGFQHDSTSDGLATIWKIGKDSGLWDTYIRTDTQLITKKKLGANAKNLDYFDAIFFYTSGELDLDDEQKQALLEFVRTEGKGFMAAHSGVDTLYSWPEYGELVGGYFDLHPWNQFKAKIVNEDGQHPATSHFPKDFFLFDEIYQLKNYSRDRVRVLMSLDVADVDLAKKGVHRTDKDFAVSWVRNYGKGRVFVSTLGHRTEIWEHPQVQKMWLEAAKWVMNLTPGGDATPRPAK